MNVTHTRVDSPLGELTLVAAGGALSHVDFSDSKNLPAAGDLGPRDDAGLAPARRQLAEYFAGRRTRFELPLAPRGTAFQLRVWARLREIPFGETRSYRQIAEELGDPALARAVGAANGRNPLAVVVPCHRVIGADGSLTGYAGGLARKRALLALEATAGPPGEALAARAGRAL